jgi:hypothetical protein
MTRGVWWRLQGEALGRREARRCATEPHPAAVQVWQAGDWATPDRLVCGRCFATLATRRHRPDTPRPVNAAGPAAGAPEEEDHDGSV